MAVTEVLRYEATDGTLFTDERAATKYQDSLNNTDRVKFRVKSFENFITTQLNSKDEEISILYKRLVNNVLDFEDSQPFFERVWLGKITDIKTNQRGSYETLLNTILGENEVHLKSDGTYFFSQLGGVNTLMEKKADSEGNVLDLNVRYNSIDYRLSTDPTKQGEPKTFTLTDVSGGKTISSRTQFVNNVYNTGLAGITITWLGGPK